MRRSASASSPASTCRASARHRCRRPNGSATPTASPKQQKWYAGETISLGIGQGYNTFTMLQIARPTVDRGLGGGASAAPGARDRDDSHVSAVRGRADAVALWLQARARRHSSATRMVGVTQEGTSARAFLGAATQRRQDRHRAGDRDQAPEREVQRLADRRAPPRPRALHGLRAARGPKIALAIVVENAGFGARAAAPIARRVLRLSADGPVPERGRHLGSRFGGVGARGAERRIADGCDAESVRPVAGLAPQRASKRALHPSAPAHAGQITMRRPQHEHRL
jgi:penicillin-binding protein 2